MPVAAQFSIVCVIFLLNSWGFCTATSIKEARKIIQETQQLHLEVAHKVSELRKLGEDLAIDGVTLTPKAFEALKKSTRSFRQTVFSMGPQNGDVNVSDALESLFKAKDPKNLKQLGKWKGKLHLGFYLDNETSELHLIYYNSEASADATSKGEAEETNSPTGRNATEMGGVGHGDAISEQVMEEAAKKKITLLEAKSEKNKEVFHNAAACKISTLRGFNEKLISDKKVLTPEEFADLKNNPNPAHHIILDVPVQGKDVTVNAALEQLKKKAETSPDFRVALEMWRQHLTIGLYLDVQADTGFALSVIYYYTDNPVEVDKTRKQPTHIKITRKVDQNPVVQEASKVTAVDQIKAHTFKTTKD